MDNNNSYYGQVVDQDEQVMESSGENDPNRFSFEDNDASDKYKSIAGEFQGYN